MSLSKPTGFSGKHAFGFLNFAQFLSAFNDNLFKFLTIFLLIDIKGVEASNDILFLIGVAYVLPFLLFSSLAGLLADRYSKQKMIVYTKVLEVIIIGLAFFVYAHKIIYGCYALVFMLSLQSALLSPSKYSIVPELVRRDQIVKANGHLTSGTYLAVIIGTFLATFLTDMTGKNFMLCLSVCMAAAVVGLWASLYIPHTAPRKTDTKIHANIFSQVMKTMKYCKKTPRLRLAVWGSAFFLFIGGYMQLNIIPYAIEFLHMTETGGGYLFFATAVGIACGALIGGKVCKREVDLGLACFGILFFALMLFGLVASGSVLALAVAALFGLGFFGGMFVVPLDSYVQAFSPSEIRGQVVSTSSFLSFMCLLFAPIVLYLFGSVLNVSSRTGFVFIAISILVVFALMTRKLFVAFAHFVSKRIVQPFYDLHFIRYPFGAGYLEEKFAIVMEKASLRHLLLLLGESSKIHVFVVKDEETFMDRFLRRLDGINIVYSDQEFGPSEMQEMIDGIPSRAKPVFFFGCAKAYQSFVQRDFFNQLIQESGYKVKSFVLKNMSHFKPDWDKPLQYTQMTFDFIDFLEYHNKGICLLSKDEKETALVYRQDS